VALQLAQQCPTQARAAAVGDVVERQAGIRQVGEQQGKRTRFHHIQAESFTWDWEGSNDGGKTLTLRWRLHYQRARS